VSFTAKRDSVAERFQIVNYALGSRVCESMVRVSSGFERILSRIDVVPGRGTSRGGLVALGKPHALPGQRIQVGRIGLAAVTSNIEVAGIIRNNEHKVGLSSRCKAGSQAKDE